MNLCSLAREPMFMKNGMRPDVETHNFVPLPPTLNKKTTQPNRLFCIFAALFASYDTATEFY